MDRPQYASDDLYKVMHNTWKVNPDERPTFSELVSKMGAFLEANVKDYYLDLSLHYIKMLSDEEDGKDIATDSDGYLRMPNNGTGDYNTMEDSPTEQKTF